MWCSLPWKGYPLNGIGLIIFAPKLVTVMSLMQHACWCLKSRRKTETRPDGPDRYWFLADFSLDETVTALVAQKPAPSNPADAALMRRSELAPISKLLPVFYRQKTFVSYPFFVAFHENVIHTSRYVKSDDRWIRFLWHFSIQTTMFQTIEKCPISQKSERS